MPIICYGNLKHEQTKVRTPIWLGIAHLKILVYHIGDNLNDEQTTARALTSLALAALAETTNPFGGECLACPSVEWNNFLLLSLYLEATGMAQYRRNMVTGMHTSAPGVSDAARDGICLSD